MSDFEGGLTFRPRGADDPAERVPAVVWSAAARGGLFVIPTDGSPRRYVHVKRIKGAWVEVDR